MPFGMSWSALGNKVAGGIETGLKIGQKVAHGVTSIAHKVSGVAGVAATGAAALGLEPVAAGLAAVGGAAKAVELGARGIGVGLDAAETLSGVARSGIERVKKMSKGGAVNTATQGAGLVKDFRQGRAAYRTLRR